jgi:SAM-dependent methyltransferase
MTIKCKVCGKVDFKELYSNIVDPVTNEKFSVKRCMHCGVGQTFPFYTDLSKYYPVDYRDFLPLVKVILNFLYEQIADGWSVAKGRKASNFLEVGCGPGFFLKFFLRKGLECYAIERPTAQLLHLKKSFPNVNITANLSEIGCSNFDIVLLYHVLEHLENPIDVIHQLDRIMNVGAIMIVAIPNFGCLQNRIFGRNWFHLDPPRHRFHFEESSFKTLMMNLGFELEKVYRFHLILDTFCFIESFVNLFAQGKNFISKNLFSRKNYYSFVAILMVIILFAPALIVGIVGYMFNNSTVNTYVFRKV